MKPSKRFRCALIGTGSVLIECGEELLRRGHEVVGVATPDSRVRAWTGKRSIGVWQSFDQLRSAVAPAPDVLLSIVNDDVLPVGALDWAARSINYHDGPLPRYAGIHATSWAILGAEARHGVTWHMMSDRIDFGDVLVQEPFEIEDHDTAFTLNARAYEAALRSFRTLLIGLESERLEATAQDEAARTYFGRHRRPARAGIVDWTSGADEIRRLARALDFGPYDNKLCAVRVWTGSRFLLATGAELTDTGPHATPGTIISVGEGSLRVATGAVSDVRLTGLRETDGAMADLSDARFACARRLPSLAAGEIDEIARLDAESHRAEAWWINRLAMVSSIQTPFASAQQISSMAGPGDVVSVPLASSVALTVDQQVAAFVVYLAKVSRNSAFDLRMGSAGQRMCPAARALFETHPWIHVDIGMDRPFESIVRSVAEEIGLIRSTATCARDLVARSVRLRDIPDLKLNAMHHAAIDPAGEASAWSLLTLMPGAAGATLVLRVDVLGAELAKAIAEQLDCLMHAAASNSSTVCSRLPILTSRERTRVLDEFAGPARNYESGITLVDLIDRTVRSSPDLTAVRFEGRSVSYRELDAMSNRMAHRLQQLGAKPGMLIGVCLERSVELVAALVAVVKSGGAYVPLDPSYPAERLNNMAEDAGLSVLMTSATMGSKHSAEFLEAWSGTTIDVGDSTLAECPDTRPDCEAQAHDVAYVIFTSGSTGRPKGAANAHAGIVNRLQWMQEYYQLSPNDRVLQKTPYSFDVSVWEFFWPLMVGATIVVAKPEGHRDSAYLAELIRREEVSVLHFVPSMLRVFLEERDIESCTSIRRVVASGEALPIDVVDRFYNRLPQARLANLYGPTEAAIDVTAWECVANDARGIVPIGAAVPNTFMYVLDEHGVPMPAQVPGELFIGGVQVGLGYVSRPELTHERFVQDPFRPGSRMYKTGDLGRFLADGTIEYLGRLDDQVKIRGFRIELGEIEAILARQPSVREVAVIAREDIPGAKRIVAYVVGDASHTHLRAALAQTLPEYMVPAAFVSLDQLPVTANGKLDRRALPAPPRGAGLDTDRPHMAPTNELESLLASIWSGVLDLPRVSIDDNFFEIGGDSILALRIVARASEVGIGIAVHELFRSPTVRLLAATAKDARAGHTPRSSAFSLVTQLDRDRLPDGVVDAYPLSALQNGMVFHSERAVGSYLYQVAMSLHVRARLDLALLQRAVDHVVERHPLLRTSFDLGTFSEAMQLVHERVSAPIEFLDISHLSADAQNELLARWIDDEAEYEFDWSKPPLLKYTVHRRSDETFQFGITFHDAILDGWSTSNMMTEIFSRYVALLAGEPEPTREANPVTYREFVALERETLRSAEAKQFWVGLMEDAPMTQIPRLPGVGRDVAVARNLDVIVPIPDDVNQRVIGLAREHGVPLKAFYLAAHMRVLSMIAAQDDVVTGLVMNGRIEDPGGDSCLGNHLNTMPYRLQVSDASWLDLARAAHEAELAALPHRRYIGAQLLRDLGRAGQDNLFETGFNYTHFHVYDRLADRKDFELLRVDFTDPFHYVFVANFRVDAFDKRLDVVLNYNTKHMTVEQVRQAGRYYIAALRAIAADPAAPATAASIMPSSEQHRILSEFAGAARSYDTDTTLDRLFADQVQRAPDATAVIFEGASVSYRELDARVNQLAHVLIAQGVQPGDLVGVCLERSIELVVALLAVMRAGAAYVPLDPSYPAERLAGMMEDARIRTLVDSTATRAAFAASQSESAILRIPVDGMGVCDAPRSAPAVRVTSRGAAYAIFTSGSTGRPKAALNSHAAVVNRLRWMQEYYQIGPTDRVLQKTPYSFDVSVWEFFWPLMTGATLVVAKPDGHRDTAYLVEVMRQYEVSVVHFVPSMLRAFVEESGLDGLGKLRRVVCSGEALPVELVERFFEVLPQVALANLYGPTEAAVDVTAWECAPKLKDGIVPIGQAVPNTHLLVLDARRELSPVGSPGELYIGGAQVGLGYAHRPELTAERFVSHPFRPGDRLYRTGDLGRFLPDGTIEYLGRIDDQVKIRGFRIELGEIQHAISKHPFIEQAAVVVRRDGETQPRIVAYVVGSAEAGELKSFLARTLPEYMIPSAFVMLPELPVTSNGKLDRKALPAPARLSVEREDGRAAQATDEVGAALAAIWAEVLRLKYVAPSDNFFEIGGDSILSIQVCARARRQGILITPAQVFDYPSIEQLSPHARRVGGLTADQGLVTGETPLIPVQQWLLDQNLAQPDHWNASVLIEFPASVTDAQIESALQRIVQHHDALRLRFHQERGQWTQRIAEPDVNAMKFLSHAVTHMDESETAAEIRRVGESLQTCLSIEQGPVFCAGVFRDSAATTARLLMVAHHLVLDGFSWRLIIEDLMALCDHSGAASLPPKTHSIRDWGRMLQEFASVVSGSPHEREWWAHESGVSHAIPLDHDSRPHTESSTFTITHTLGEEETHAVLQIAPAKHGAQINDILLAALGLSLREWSAREIVRIDMMGHGREHLHDDLDVSRTVGWFTTIFPVSLSLSQLHDPAVAVRLVRDHLRQIPRRGIGFGILRSWDRTELGQALRSAQPSQISFNYLGQFDQVLAPGWSMRLARTFCGPTRGELNHRPAAIEIDAMVLGNVLRVDWSASSVLHERSSIERLASLFDKALVAIVQTVSESPKSQDTPKFDLVDLDDDGLARLSALFDSGGFKDD